jgi:hypothetical protein
MAKRTNEDSDHYGYNDSNTSVSGGIDGVPLYASDIGSIVLAPTNRKKKIKKPKLVRKKSKRK